MSMKKLQKVQKVVKKGQKEKELEQMEKGRILEEIINVMQSNPGIYNKDNENYKKKGWK